MSQSRQFRDDPQSFRNTDIPRGNTKRYDSHDVMRMGGQKARSVEVEPVETEACKELRKLAKRQADTDITLSGTLAKKKQFVGSSVHKSLKESLEGKMSLLNYQEVANRDEQMEELHMLGLTDEEIEFKLKYGSEEITREGNLGVDPLIIRSRLEEINKKIKAKEEYFSQKDKFQPQKKLTRHEMDLEKSLVPNDPKSSKIRHLLVTVETMETSEKPSNEITDLLKEITERPKLSDVELGSTIKEEEIKCVRCQQIDILVKYGHQKKSLDSVECSDCQYLQRMDKLNKGDAAVSKLVISQAAETCTVRENRNSVSTVTKPLTPDSKTNNKQELIIGSCKSTRTVTTLPAPDRKSNANQELDKDDSVSILTSLPPQDKKSVSDQVLNKDDFIASTPLLAQTTKTEQASKPSTNANQVIGPLKRGQLAPWTKHEEIEEVPQRILERFRLTLDEIKSIPKFANYMPGEPTKTLFLKNLSPKVTEYDLVSLFRRYEARGSISYRLLTGRMKGQAFVTFHDVKTASEALQLVNGYLLKDKPIIIQYGKKS